MLPLCVALYPFHNYENTYLEGHYSRFYCTLQQIKRFILKNNGDYILVFVNKSYEKRKTINELVNFSILPYFPTLPVTLSPKRTKDVNLPFFKKALCSAED